MCFVWRREVAVSRNTERCPPVKSDASSFGERSDECSSSLNDVRVGEGQSDVCVLRRSW